MRNARFMLLVLLSSLLVLNGCSRRDILDDYPVASAQRREPAAACSPYGERRKARNRNTIPPMGVGVKKRATPSTARITEAIVSRTAQISNRNTSRAARRDNAKAKGATNIFSSIFIIKTSFILSISILSCLPGDINVAKD